MGELVAGVALAGAEPETVNVVGGLVRDVLIAAIALWLVVYLPIKGLARLIFGRKSSSSSFPPTPPAGGQTARQPAPWTPPTPPTDAELAARAAHAKAVRYQHWQAAGAMNAQRQQQQGK